MEYQDRWTRWHHKPVTNGNASSNNGWKYSADSLFLKPGTLDREKLVECYRQCIASEVPLKINRSPGQIYPAKSKDEIMGLRILGLLTDDELQEAHYNHCNLPEYNNKGLSFIKLIRAIKALLDMNKSIKEQKLTGGKVRNYVWENKVVDAYPLAFRLPPEDIYVSRKLAGKFPGIFNTIIFHLSTIVTILTGKKSPKMFMWMKLKALDSFYLKFINESEYIKNYYPEGHPFCQGL